MWVRDTCEPTQDCVCTCVWMYMGECMCEFVCVGGPVRSTFRCECECRRGCGCGCASTSMFEQKGMYHRSVNRNKYVDLCLMGRMQVWPNFMQNCRDESTLVVCSVPGHHSASRRESRGHVAPYRDRVLMVMHPSGNSDECNPCSPMHMQRVRKHSSLIAVSGCCRW